MAFVKGRQRVLIHASLQCYVKLGRKLRHGAPEFIADDEQELNVQAIALTNRIR